MKRIIQVMVLAIFTAVPALSQSLYDHNGSVMRLERSGSNIEIYYEKPRSGLSKFGVRSGTLLFKGKLDNTNYLDGMSRIFSSRCGEIDYFVYGDYQSGQKLLLRGAAPVLAKNSCHIIDNTYEGSNANLVFTPIALQPSPQQAQSQPTQKGMDCITNVGVGSTLNMRAGPSTQYGIVAEIPHGSCNVQIGETCIADWCGVRHDDRVGWVNIKFLKRR